MRMLCDFFMGQPPFSHLVALRSHSMRDNDPMKLQPCLKLGLKLGALGAFAFGAIAPIHQSAAASPANASTPTCPHSNDRLTTVVPPHPVSTTPVSYPPIPMECMEEEKGLPASGDPSSSSHFR